MKLKAAVAAVLLFACAKPALASVVCEKRSEPVDWAYCVTRTEGSANPDVVFYLHGIFDDENRWSTEDLALGIQSRWKDSGVQAPTVVAVNFGRVTLLTEKNESKLSGLLDVFLNDSIPYIERTHALAGGRRILYGESMGGFNALQAYLKAPELFSRVA